MSEQKRTLNGMEGFQKGFKATMDLNQIFDSTKNSNDEYLAFALGSIAAIYNSIDDNDELWRVRQKFWHTEEALGQSRSSKIESTVNSELSDQ